jgi:hypothetical protein
MFNVFSNSLFVASQSSQRYRPGGEKMAQRRLNNTTTDLFQKDLYKSSLTEFYLENLWKKYTGRGFQRDVTQLLSAPLPTKTPIAKWSAPTWWRASETRQCLADKCSGYRNIISRDLCITPFLVIF